MFCVCPNPLTVHLHPLPLPRARCHPQVPMKTIASNAGVEGAVIIGKVEEQEEHTIGYDAATDQFTGT